MLHLTLVFLCIASMLIAQTATIDRLKYSVQTAGSASDRLQQTLILCKQGYNLHPDTLLSYAGSAGLLAKQLHDESALLYARYYACWAFTNKGLLDTSLAIADSCMAVLEQKKEDPLLQANLANQKGRCYMRQNEYKEAIAMGYKVIALGEEIDNPLLQMQGKTLIGWAHLEIGQTSTSLDWHLRALHTTTDSSILKSYGILFANLALNYKALGDMNKAFDAIEKAIRFSRENDNLFALSNSLAIESQLFLTVGNQKGAEDALKETVAIRKLIGDPFYIVSDMAQLSLFYAHNNEPDKGVSIAKEGRALAERYNLDTKLFFLYGVLAENYKVSGQTAAYANVLEETIALKDSIYGRNSAAALAEMRTRYELQKKENRIIQQDFDLARKNYLIGGGFLLSLLIAVAALLVLRNSRFRQRIRVEKLLADEKLNAAMAVKEAEERERRRISADLHDNLGVYAASMAAQIDFLNAHVKEERPAKALQQLQASSQAIISQLSDTIWVLKKDSLSLTALSDRIKAFMKAIQHAYPDVLMEVDEAIDHDEIFTAGKAFHLYRIVQEAITNALRHSESTHILVRILSTQDWQISITDNGRGIEGDELKAGNGLTNMKTRAAEAGWNIEWVRPAKGGTSVIVTPTTN